MCLIKLCSQQRVNDGSLPLYTIKKHRCKLLFVYLNAQCCLFKMDISLLLGHNAMKIKMLLPYYFIALYCVCWFVMVKRLMECCLHIQLFIDLLTAEQVGGSSAWLVFVRYAASVSNGMSDITDILHVLFSHSREISGQKHSIGHARLLCAFPFK
jgi:hypothetical protein